MISRLRRNQTQYAKRSFTGPKREPEKIDRDGSPGGLGPTASYKARKKNQGRGHRTLKAATTRKRERSYRSNPTGPLRKAPPPNKSRTGLITGRNESRLNVEEIEMPASKNGETCRGVHVPLLKKVSQKTLGTSILEGPIVKEHRIAVEWSVCDFKDGQRLPGGRRRGTCRRP